MGPKRGKGIVLSSDSSGASMVPKKRKAIMQSESSSDDDITPAPTTQLVQQDKSGPAEQEEHDESADEEEEPEDVKLPAYLAKAVEYHIPSGPVFQVDVPDVTEVLDTKSYRDRTEDSKWLGTKVWSPLDDNADNSDIGRGKPTINCGCRAPGSENCVRRHVNEKRAQLRHQLGPAFEAWGFDEMGEDVARSWDAKREKVFKNLISAKEEILQPGLPLKLKKTYKEMVSYYFNVLVLKRVCAQARRGDRVDSDDDTYVDKRRKTKVSQQASATASSKFLKPLH